MLCYLTLPFLTHIISIRIIKLHNSNMTIIIYLFAVCSALLVFLHNIIKLFISSSQLYIYKCMYAWMYVCIYVCMYVRSYIPLGILYPCTTTSSDVSFPIIGATGCNLSVSLIHIPRYSSLDKSCLNTPHQHTYIHTTLLLDTM